MDHNVKKKKIFIISSISISLILILSLLISIFAVRQFKNMKGYDGENTLSEGSVRKNDDFIGPASREHSEDRDGIFDSLAIDPNNSNIVYLGTENNALFKTVDGGKTWTWLREGIYHDDRSYPEFYGIQVNPLNSNIIYAITTNGPMPVDSEFAAGFYLSEDAGSNWERYTEGLPSTGATALATRNGTLLVGLDGASPTHPDIIGQDIKGGLFKSLDNGKTWQEVINEKAYPDVRYAEIVMRDSVLYASVLHWDENDPNKNHGSIIKSLDQGKTWMEISPEGFFPIHYDVSSSGEVIYATACSEEFGTQKSDDQGKTWNRVPGFTCNKIRHSPHQDDTLIFITGDKVMKTTDGFKTSHEVFNTGGDSIDDIEFAPNDKNIVYLAGEGYKVYKSLDGGENFEQIADLREFIEQRRQ